MKRSSQTAASLLFGIMLILANMGLFPQALALSHAAPVVESEPRATLDLTLEAGQRSWNAVARETVADDAPMAEFPAGLMLALDDPLLLFMDGEGTMARLPADAAFAMSELTTTRPVAMMAETPVSFLTVELSDPTDITDREPMPFEVAAGTYTMSVWYVDVAMGVPEAVGEHLASLTLPMLVVVRSGAIEVPSTDASGSTSQVASGEWTVVAPGTQIVPAPDSGPPVLLFVTLQPPLNDVAVEPAQSGPGPQGDSAPQGGTVPQGESAPQGGSVPHESAPQGGSVPHESAPPPTDPAPFDPSIEPESTVTPISIGDGSESGPNGSSGPDDGPNETSTGGSENGGGGEILTETEYIPILVPTVPSSEGDVIIEDTEFVPILIPTVDPNASGSQTPPIVGGVSASSVEVQDVADDDGDGFINMREVELGTYTDKWDSDRDGLSDGDEVNTYGSKPTVSDSDGDGLADGNEVHTYRTLPTVKDSDEDGLEDGYELGAGLGPVDSDSDDNLSDGDEMNYYGTYPREYDSDGDGLGDGDEILSYGSNPLDKDYDDDCLIDGDEVAHGTDIFRYDTDDDGQSDGSEIGGGTDPLEAGIHLPGGNAICS
jgi:hypothetical protein